LSEVIEILPHPNSAVMVRRRGDEDRILAGKTAQRRSLRPAFDTEELSGRNMAGSAGWNRYSSQVVEAVTVAFAKPDSDVDLSPLYGQSGRIRAVGRGTYCTRELCYRLRTSGQHFPKRGEGKHFCGVGGENLG